MSAALREFTPHLPARKLAGRAWTVVAIVVAGLVVASQRPPVGFGAEPAAEVQGLPLVFHDDFSTGASRWEPTDAAAWRVVDGPARYSLFGKSKYTPPHRSPFNIALVRDVDVGDFVFDVRALSTIRDYGHRDLCLVFGYQDPAHFYYVHFGKQTDDHANQIFIVNGAPRVKISTKTTPGTPWDEQWHDLRIVRRVAMGTIAVYFDDLTTPVMEATERSFLHGRVGVGSFDDTGDFTQVRLYGAPATPQK